jgi:hypothetical protein
VRHVLVQPKVKEGRPDVLSAFARVMAAKKMFNKPVPLSSLLDHVSELTDADKVALAKAQTRTRWLNKAFSGEGVMEYLTDHGKLIRTATRGGKVGTRLTLRMPAVVSEPEQDGDEESVTT